MANGNCKPKIYWRPESPPCRTIYAVAKLLDIVDDFEWNFVDTFTKEQLSPEYTAINPFHTIPTLVEPDGFIMYESRAMAAYIIHSRQPESTLYPLNDFKRRALIDRCLHWELGTLFRAISDVVYPILRLGVADLEKLPHFHKTLETFDEYLSRMNDDEYMAGGRDHPSLADISTYFTMIIGEAIDEIDLTHYEHIQSWLARMHDFIVQLDIDRTLQSAQQRYKEFVQHMIEQHLEQHDDDDEDHVESLEDK